MDNTLNQEDIPAFHKKQRKAHKKSEDKNTVHESLVSFRRGRRPETHRRTRRNRREMKIQEKDHGVMSGNSQDDDEEKEEVERKIVALQRIVPGGESLEVDKLFEETAGYILALQCQIKAMRTFASFLEGMEKEKSKFGG